MGTMRAMRFHRTAPIEESPLQLDEVPVPEPGPDQVLVKVHANGLCHGRRSAGPDVDLLD